MIKKQFMVSETDANQRLDKFLIKVLSGAPKSFIFKLIRKKDIKVNNKKTTANYIIQQGDIVTVYLTTAQKEDFVRDYHFTHTPEPLDVIYEDENIIVINKKRGIPVHQTAKVKEKTLTNIVLTYLYNKQAFDPAERGYIPSPVARIDQYTTGVVIFAKKQSVHQSLADAFQKRAEVIRKYHLVVYGILMKDEDVIDVSLRKKGSVVYPDKTGLKSLTSYKVLRRLQTKTLVEATLVTGRSNQIRVHFAALGHPLVGDAKYGNVSDENDLALNAYKVMFINLKAPLDYLNGKPFIAYNEFQNINFEE